MSDTLTNLPIVAQASYARLRVSIGQIEAAICAAEDNRTSFAEALDDGIDADMAEYVRGDLERAEQEIANAVARLVLEYTNALRDDDQRRLALGLANDHPSLLANVLQATLQACRKHKGDVRLPEWSWQDDLPVPTV